LILGLFEKVILADTIMAPVADHVYGNTGAAGTVDAWSGVLAFSAQVFFDFSGYSLCAIGVAMTFGFVLPDNFRFPYAAVGFSDFWQRWHISLSTWLRDYLYISLGGNRKGELRTYVNLMLTMLLGGLWHGASWTYVVWGGLHGLYLAVERYLSTVVGDLTLLKNSAVRLVLSLATFFLVTITYVFFRARQFGDAFELLGVKFTWRRAGLVDVADSLQVFVVAAALLAGHGLLRNTSLEYVASKTPYVLRIAVVVAALLTLSLHTGGERAFIYFQF